MKPFHCSVSIRLAVFLLFSLPILRGNAVEEAVLPGGVCYSAISIPAESLRGNLTGEPCVQTDYVFLPPSYDRGEKRYPVLYFFTGFEMTSDIGYLEKVLSSVMERGEYIIVSVNDINSLQGSFGAGSPVIGSWSEFYLNEVIPYIDGHFRTVVSPEGRAVGGFSMGGHIAVRLAFGHPEIFSILYAVSPGLFDENGLKNAMHTWDDIFLKAYGAAYAPNPDIPYPHAEIPSMDGSTADMAIQEKWNKGFGDLPEMVELYLSREVRLKAICIEVGIHDAYPWILDGCICLDSLLSSKKIAHAFVLTGNGHDFTPEIFRTGMGRYVSHAFFPQN